MGVFDKVKVSLGLQEEQEPSLIEEFNEATTLTRMQRLWGFCICFGLGIFLSIVGSISVFFGHFVTFGVTYSFGNILALGSTMFLVGPWKQTKNMFKEKRIVATSIYLVMLVITLVVAFKLQNGALVLICVFIQFLAMLWYSISYIPFARDVVKKCLCNCFGMDDGGL
mmetsp:Transcript_3499/g.12612  ORF Transcript_3499/g.12612 Transcript_3499/m.12612 type:complete len:168 (-) Transcript_3499:186-689(-)